MNYIISGTGVAICDGMEEELRPGVMYICPQGSKYSILNSGDTDLEMLTIVVKSKTILKEVDGHDNNR